MGLNTLQATCNRVKERPRSSRIRMIFGSALLFAWLVTAANAFSQSPASPSMTWPEATAQIVKLRTTSETCVSIVKQYGNAAQKAQIRLAYGDAKANVDAIIAGLTVALYEDGKSGSLPSLQEDLQTASNDVQSFCGVAGKVLPTSSKHKGVVDEIAKASIEPLIKAVSDGIAALYNNHRNDKELVKKTIQAQLEAAKWQDFDKIPSGQ